MDVAKGYARKWAEFFRDLEKDHGLNVESPAHLWLLHYLFLSEVNKDAIDWAITWNNHGMRLPRGERSGQSPIIMWTRGMAENGIRGFDAINTVDPAYEEDPDNYGVDWADADDQRLAAHVLRRTDEAQQAAPQAFEAAANPPQNIFVNNYSSPPRWSRVTVDPPNPSLLTEAELQSLNDHLNGRVDRADRSMNARRMLWIHALRFATQLFDRRM